MQYSTDAANAKTATIKLFITLRVTQVPSKYYLQRECSTLNVSWDFITFKLGIFLSNNTTTMLVGNYFDHSIQLQMIRKSIVLIYAKLFQSYTSAS